MVVILKRDVKGTGRAGDVVKVNDGYARNMLIPKGYAIEATKGNIRSLEKVKEKQAEEEAQQRAAASEKAEQLKKAQVTIVTKSGEGGRLFGSITSKDIADAVKEQTGISVDKKKIKLDQPIKNLGTFHVEIKLYYDINAEITVTVTD
ncbi:LSU ribosomal protein L9P [Eubacterium pyruvativorans]|jgi:large subunit ribosomal protein L9|uniref:Large ribosomal subunit protein bL9 n=1 Tax=Eubacterium pyruvativorans TaxID=155865 RepID=A0A1I7HT83_9FIRM|nr:50S ribosomal protein L9 [Eubacterium pyruvativorans]MDO5568378.1 50S ribosomal protein L9 [Eubacteriales bacterium]HAT81997.1 50S ribosomal protein L9 [Eubacterium sp.]MCI5746533.1 50S ribosomal protein L9 [Eubacterium pyruvativorans]MDD6707306.1 50S ribosomal protein L9 [Eubacterium pyruvativorans]MDD7685050.1 50S ribosomal protein L9 [Eubacterium pyruvativorans]